MMDGRGGRRFGRRWTAAGFAQTPILSYAAKYARLLLWAFREAAESDAAVRRPAQLQMDPPTRGSGCGRLRWDLEEGADMIMGSRRCRTSTFCGWRGTVFDEHAGGIPRFRANFSMIMAAVAQRVDRIATGPILSR